MSGRARHWRDGERITNRKTDARRAQSIPGHEMPPWQFTVPLPGAFAFAVSPGPTGIGGVSIGKSAAGAVQLEAEGRNTAWMLDQIAAYLGRIANGWQGRLHLQAHRDGYPGLTSGAPLRSAIDRAQDVYLIMEPSLVIPSGHREPLILKVRTR